MKSLRSLLISDQYIRWNKVTSLCKGTKVTGSEQCRILHLEKETAEGRCKNSWAALSAMERGADFHTPFYCKDQGPSDDTKRSQV